jgi:hypothetical protein
MIGGLLTGLLILFELAKALLWTLAPPFCYWLWPFQTSLCGWEWSPTKVGLNRGADS